MHRLRAQLANPADPEKMHFDSLPYLRNTLTYQKNFPVLWDARDFMHERGR